LGRLNHLHMIQLSGISHAIVIVAAGVCRSPGVPTPRQKSVHRSNRSDMEG
jgi:hypothetical protein